MWKSVATDAICIFADLSCAPTFRFPAPTLRPPGPQQLKSERGKCKGTWDLGRNPVCLRGHMLYRVEIVSYSLEVYSRDKQRPNCNSHLESSQCLLLNAGEETGCCKMIIEKKVGGPLWPPWPSGTVILRLLHVLKGADYRMLYLKKRLCPSALNLTDVTIDWRLFLLSLAIVCVCVYLALLDYCHSF